MAGLYNYYKVRDQEKEFARQVRENVKRKKEEERRILEDHIKVQWLVFNCFGTCVVEIHCKKSPEATPRT